MVNPADVVGRGSWSEVLPHRPNRLRGTDSMIALITDYGLVSVL